MEENQQQFDAKTQRKLTELNKKLNELNKRTNKAFEKASPAKKRVMVAEDVLKQIQASKYQATPGTYFAVAPKHGRDSELFEHIIAKEKNQLGAFVDLPITECNVCAVGAAFASVTRLHDKLSIEEADLNSWGHETEWCRFDNYLQKYFPMILLEEMERAFENREYGYNMSDARNRLKAIFRNLVDNAGKKFTAYAKYEVENGAFDLVSMPKDTVIWKS